VRALSGPIVINARTAIRTQITGVERWAVELARRLPVLRPGAYEVVAPRPRLAHRPGHLWEQTVLPARAARMGARSVFNPSNAAPLLWPRNVVTIHDVVVLSKPEWFSRGYATWYGTMVPRVARSATAVIVRSEFAAEELTEQTGVPRERIHVVPGGIDARLNPEVDPEPARAALGLERPYVLTVGGLGFRKNLRALEPAAPRLAAQGIELVAAGVTRSNLGDVEDLRGIRGLGYVPDELLPSLYAGARAFVLPSLHEGYGLTCIEAMACGVPVAASDRPALPDTCGGAAIHFDPDDPEATTDAVLRAATDDAERARLRELGLRHAAGLTWDRVVEAVDAVLVSV
jgi:glycosyltransferase involved in cell wall biosynthesis